MKEEMLVYADFIVTVIIMWSFYKSSNLVFSVSLVTLLLKIIFVHDADMSRHLYFSQIVASIVFGAIATMGMSKNTTRGPFWRDEDQF